MLGPYIVYDLDNEEVVNDGIPTFEEASEAASQYFASEGWDRLIILKKVGRMETTKSVTIEKVED